MHLKLILLLAYAVVFSNGGIIPTIAQDLHRQNIENVVDGAIRAANLNYEAITAIATTVKPGKIDFSAFKL